MNPQRKQFFAYGAGLMGILIGLLCLFKMVNDRASYSPYEWIAGPVKPVPAFRYEHPLALVLRLGDSRTTNTLALMSSLLDALKNITNSSGRVEYREGRVVVTVSLRNDEDIWAADFHPVWIGPEGVSQAPASAELVNWTVGASHVSVPNPVSAEVARDKAKATLTDAIRAITSTDQPLHGQVAHSWLSSQ